MAAVQITTHERAGIRHQRMVRRRAQSCNTPATQRALPDQVRTWDAMRRCLGIEPRQVGIRNIELDFRHFWCVDGANGRSDAKTLSTTGFGRKRTQVGRKKPSHTKGGRKIGVFLTPPYMCVLFTPLHSPSYFHT